MNKYKLSLILSYIFLPIIIMLTVITFIAGIYRTHINDYSISGDYFKALFYGGMQSSARDMIFNNNSMKVIHNDGHRIIYLDSDRVVSINNLKYAIYYNDLIITNVPLNDNNTTKESIENVITSNLNNDSNIKTYRLKDGIVETNCNYLKATATEVSQKFEFEYYKYNESIDPNAEYTNETEKIITNISDFEIYATFNDSIKNYTYELYNHVSFLGENAEIICIVSIILTLVLLYIICTCTGKDSNGKLNIVLNTFDKRAFEIVLLFELIVFTCATVLLVRFFDTFDYRTSINYNPLIASILIYYFGFVVGFNTLIKRIKSHTFIKNSITYKIAFQIKNIIIMIKKYIDQNYSKSTSRIVFGIFLVTLLIWLIGSFGLLGIIITVFSVVSLILEMIKKSNAIQDEAINSKITNERLKAELITNVSHDIKTPLTSIINYIDLLKKENLDNENAKEYIKILDEKSQRLKKLTEDLIEVSKASSGNLKLNLEKIDILEFLNQAIGEFEDKFKYKNLLIEKNFPSNKILILLDSRYMFRIIENIFSNIEKYALENTRVYIDVLDENDKVTLLFKNTSKEKLNISENELMQRFVRGNKSRTTEGSGLGLAIISSLVEAHNGKYDLQIDGDLFKISLTFFK